LNIGFVLAGSVLLFTWLGVTLDKHWSTHPWLTVVGAFLGIFTGFYHFIKTILNEQKKQQNQFKKNQNIE
jgi:F0F1-type ATP synthase assembly protein I